MTQVCTVCFAKCRIPEGGTGRCGARKNVNEKIVAANYGMLTSMALDPIEKKPLRRFYPGAKILSVGSYGCNLRCPFCQNHAISMARQITDESRTDSVRLISGVVALSAEFWSPERLVELASTLKTKGNIGIAFTYNEPLIGYEYVLDSAKLAHEAGLKTVMVTNGTADAAVFEQLLPYIDAMNIDLKGFREEYYRDRLKGDLQQVLKNIKLAVGSCHVELTTLIVPGYNDSNEEMQDLAAWVADLPNGVDIPLHISRFFPSFEMTDARPTPIDKVYNLAETAARYLHYVYTGNC